MLPLTDSELVQMRDTLETSLPGTAILHSPTSTSDAAGGFTQSFAAYGTVDARLSPLRQSEREYVNRIGVLADYVLTIPHGTAVNAKDRVVFDSVTYEVSTVWNRPTWELGRRVYLNTLT